MSELLKRFGLVVLAVVAATLLGAVAGTAIAKGLAAWRD